MHAVKYKYLSKRKRRIFVINFGQKPGRNFERLKWKIYLLQNFDVFTFLFFNNRPIQTRLGAQSKQAPPTHPPRKAFVFKLVLRVLNYSVKAADECKINPQDVYILKYLWYFLIKDISNNS